MALSKKARKWKSAAKSLKAEVKKLRRRKLAQQGAATDNSPPVSPLAPAAFPDLPEIDGLRAGVALAGVRQAGGPPSGRPDVALFALAAGTQLAGVFTRSATRSDAVRDCQAKLAQGAGAATAEGAGIVVNSGNANAFTGAQGAKAVAAVAAAAGGALGVPEARVFTASTGVIGEPLPYDRITGALAGMELGSGGAALAAAARAIMTTDTFPKGAGRVIDTPDGPIALAGIAKGSGMIAPDMATMLAFVFTDAAVPQPALARMLARATGESFNRITVDGDTSTSDTVLLAATGRGVAVGDLRGRTARSFERALTEVMADLARQIVRDGEGARHFVTVSVSGAADDGDARRVAQAIANSPLVKTAIAGGDANWGRVVMAVGKSGARADRDRLSIRFGAVTVAEAGQRAADYSEEAAATVLQHPEIEIGVDLGLGKGAAVVWTCDLTHGYIDINADYRS